MLAVEVAVVFAEVEATHSASVGDENVYMVAEEASASAQARHCMVVVLPLASVASGSPACISHR